MRLRTATLLAVVGALALGTAAPATAAEPTVATWNADLVTGESAGIVVDGGTARLDHSGTHLLPADADGMPVPTGLLTLPTHPLDAPTDRVETAVVGDLPEGSTAAVDVRGRRTTGGWTEWIPAADGTATLPEPTSEVQTRLVLTGVEGVEPTVDGVTVTAHPAAARSEALTEDLTESAALNYRVFATREGLAGGTTANGHVIAERDHFVALPSRRALAPRDSSDYSVKVCAPNGRCAFAPVWDVGPWNTRDDYWNPSDQRQEWQDLPQGVPQAQAAHTDGYNGGRDQYGREPSNPAGIDLGDGLFWDALGLTDNSWVTVDYLWTGSVRLSLVNSDSPVDVLAAPDAAAEVVGVAAERAAVPVECALAAGDDTWLRIGADQYIGAGAVDDAEDVATCATDTPATDSPALDDTPALGDTGAPAAGDARVSSTPFPGDTSPAVAAPGDGAAADSTTPGDSEAPGSAAPDSAAPGSTSPGSTSPGSTSPGGGAAPADAGDGTGSATTPLTNPVPTSATDPTSGSAPDATGTVAPPAAAPEGTGPVGGHATPRP